MAYIVRYDDDLAPGCDAITGSAEDPLYEARNAILDNPADPAKLTTTSGSFVLEFANKIQPVGAALIYHYLDEGLEVRIQGNSSNFWGAPPVQEVFTIPAKRRDGPSYQRWTINPWCQLEDVSNWPDPTGYKFWRVVVVGTNSQNVVIGKIMLFSAIYQFGLYSEAAEPTDRDYKPESQINLETELGVEYVETLDGPRRFMSGALVAQEGNAGITPDDELASTLRALLQSAEGRAHPFLFIPFEDNDARLVRNDTPEWERTYKTGGYQIWPFAFREVSRGIPFP